MSGYGFSLFNSTLRLSAALRLAMIVECSGRSLDKDNNLDS